MTEEAFNSKRVDVKVSLPEYNLRIKSAQLAEEGEGGVESEWINFDKV